ncbi:MAG TPA: S8 family serine peptidase [Kineosporiaceae bacterium]|nr:S8 family serine peptidase [Kineosporiaceae bacterium]
MTQTSGRFRRPGVVAAGAVAVTVVTGTATNAWAGTAPQAPTGSNSPHAVIVVLRDQVPSAPADAAHVAARAATTGQAQRGVLGRLAGPAPTKVTHFVTGNAFAATVTSAQAQALTADPAVAGVVPDVSVAVTPAPSSSAGAAAGGTAPGPGRTPRATPKGLATVTPQASAAAAPPAAAGPAIPSAPARVDPRACSTDPKRPLLEPEALQTMNVRSDDKRARTAAALGIDGKGVKVAYIADGIDPGNPAFRRASGSSAIIDYKDFYGDGPDAPTGGAEAFGDASSMVAQGRVVDDVAAFANPKVVTFPGGHCYIRIAGVAPGASLVALKAGSELLPNSAILQAIDYAVRVRHVDVLNESFGANVFPDSSARNTVQLFNDQAVRAGVTVTVATGDAGVTSTVGNPSTDPNVISTGASTDARIYEQTGYALATLLGNGRWLDSNISSLSSAGITQGGRTIDISAPGEADWAVCDSSTTTIGGTVVPRFAACTNFRGGLSDIQSFGGTSQSAPLTAGVAALVIQAYRTAHHGASPSPALVKKLISSTARDLGLPGEEQGSGLIDARAAVEAALTYPGGKPAPTTAASTVALSANQLTLHGSPGGTVKGSVTVTNIGNTTQTIRASARTYRDVAAPTRRTVTIDATSSTTTPYPTNATPWVVKTATFTVPKGADRLAASIAWQAPISPAGTGPVVRLSLFAPDGTYAGNSRPQGGPAPANYGFVQVRTPAAGRWTAVFSTPAGSGYTGDVGFETRAQHAVSAGSVSPRVTTVAPGKSTRVALAFGVPRLGGDTVYTASIASSGGHRTAVPVIVRTVVPTSTGVGIFGGTITGGNARAFSPAQTFSFAFDVPKGKRDLDVDVVMAKDPGDVLQTVLIDPNDETPSISSNAVIDGKGGGTQGLGAQNTVANPLPGRWRYVVSVQNPVSGQEIRQDFRGVVTFDHVRVGASPALPTSPAVTLPAGAPVTVEVTVKNTGVAPLPVQTDARLNALTSLQLTPIVGQGQVPLPVSVDALGALPGFLLPPDTRSGGVTATSTSPVQIEWTSPGGGIDLFGDLRQAQGGNLVSTATDSNRTGNVTQGVWFAYPQQIGPFTNAGAPTGTSTIVSRVVTKAFDPAVTSSVGDPYLASVDPTAPTGAPVVIAPGASATITVTVTPAGAKGSVTSGVLNLVTTPYGTTSFNTTGDVVARLPYAYTVG